MDKRYHSYDTIIIGGGQAGLTTGYYLKKHGSNFVILDGNERIGDQWRKRWDSLRLFTPARYCGLAGMPFPASPHTFPTKEEMADYLESYAAHFELPVQTGVQVDRLSKFGNTFLIEAGEKRFKAKNVVVAMSSYQRPVVPSFAEELAEDTVQLHSIDYRNPSQLHEGDVLVVGAGNSGVEIAIELALKHRVYLSGRYPGHVPFRIETTVARYLFVPFVLRILFHRILSVFTPIGRKVRQKALHRAGPLVRTKPTDVKNAGVRRVPRTIGVQQGYPLLEDGRTLDVANVIWCTGFHPGFSWIDLPIFDEKGDPKHEKGVVHDISGMYFVGLHFLTAISSAQIHGVERDAAYVAKQILAQSPFIVTDDARSDMSSEPQSA